MDFALIFSILFVHIVALITPGPDVLLIMRLALEGKFAKVALAASGIVCGISVWIVASSLFVSLLLSKVFMILLMSFGASYLFYIAYLLSKKQAQKSSQKIYELSGAKAFLLGFITNISNPKAIMYFISLFSLITNKLNSSGMLLLCILMICFSFLAFLLLGFVFSLSPARRAFLKHQAKIDMLCAGLFSIFAIFILKELINLLLS